MNRLLPALIAAPVAAAPLLTPDHAVELALRNGYALSLARDQREAAVLNRKSGVGPFLPSLSASASHSGSLQDSASYQTSVGASLNLLVFDGFQSYRSYRRLKSLETAASLAERAALESTVESVLGGYFEITRQKRRLEAIRELLAVSRERADLALARMELGAGSKLEQLQSLADLNADSASFLAQEMALREAKIRLNRILARDPAEGFEVMDTIPLEGGLPLEDWRAGLPSRNSALLQAEARRQAAWESQKEARGRHWPDLSAGLGYSLAPEELNPGPGGNRDDLRYNLNLSWPLFDRLQTRRAVGLADLDRRQEETRLRQQRQEILTEFEQAAQRHALGLRQIRLEEGNLEVAELQAEAARERYRVGTSTPLEFREAQRRLLDARSRMASARQETKLAELALKRMAGNLVRETPEEK